MPNYENHAAEPQASAEPHGSSSAPETGVIPGLRSRSQSRGVLSFQTLQLAPIFGSTGHSLSESIAAVAAAGFTHIGIDAHSIDAYIAGGASLADVAQMLDAHRLLCSDVAPLVLRDDPEGNIQDARRFADLATVLGAGVALVAFDSSVQDWREERLLDSVKHAVNILHDHGVRAALEYIPYTALATVGDACELRDLLGADRAGLCVDAFHTLVGNELGALRRLEASEIVMVQLDDIERQHLTDIMDASRRHRVLPGEGDLPLDDFVAALQAIGYDDLVSVEVLSDDVRSGPAAPFALASRRGMEKAWGPSTGASVRHHLGGSYS